MPNEGELFVAGVFIYEFYLGVYIEVTNLGIAVIVVFFFVYAAIDVILRIHVAPGVSKPDIISFHSKEEGRRVIPLIFNPNNG